jgi:hypothetical protein
MAREFQVLVRNPGGVLSTTKVQAGESIRVEAKHLYRVIVDGQPQLPDGTRIFRDGRHLKLKLADGSELTLLDWTLVQGTTIDTRGAQVFIEDLNAYRTQPDLLSGPLTPLGSPPDTAAVAAAPEPAPPVAATAPPAPAAGAGAPPAAPSAPPPAAPAPAASGGGGGFGGTGIILGVLGVGALAAAAGGGGGSSSGGGTTPPAASTTPSDLAIAAASDSGAQGDRITNDNTPTLTGRADPNATITVRNGQGASVATATADASGNWSATPANALPEGQQALQVVANRGGGATDSAPANIIITVDTVVPAAPTLTLREGPQVNAVENADGGGIEIAVAGAYAAGDTVALTVTRPDGTQLPVSRTVTAAEVAAQTAVVVVPAQTLQGNYQVTARITDVAGNAGAASASATFLLDTVVPAAPTARLDPASDSGTAGDNLTNVARPVISGTGTAGDGIRVEVPGATLLTTVAANGTWSVTPATALADGAAPVTVVAVDAAGNTSTPVALNLTIDATPPASPGARLDPSSDSGTAGDSVTNDTTPTISGTGTNGDTVRVTLPGGAILTATVAAGAWSVTPTVALPNGAVPFTAVATDAAGNVSPVSNLTVTVDTVPPGPPTAALDPTSDSGTLGDNLTNDTTPTISGTGVAGNSVRVTFPGGTVLTGTVAANGTWSVTPTTPLALGAAVISAVQFDPAGNASTPVALTVTINNVGPPAPPASLDPSSDSGVLGDGITNDTTPTISGTGIAGQAIRVTFPGSVVLNTTVSGGGTWSVTPTTPLAAGPATITASATDAAGNGSAATSLTITIDTAVAAPSAPDLAAASDSGVSSTDNITNATTPTFTGTGAEPGATVTLLDGGTAVGSAVASGAGAWSITTGALAAGTRTFTARQTDVAGNTSAASTGLSVTIDTGAAAPSTPDLTAGSDSGASSTDNITNDTTPTFTGTAEAGATVTLLDGGTTLGTALADGAGAWSITTAVLSPGTRTITARQTDIAGNTSVASGGAALTIDTSVAAPSTPDLAAASDSGASNTDNLTNVTTPTFTGTGEAGATVTLFDGAVAVGSATADAGGAWSITSSALAAGAHSITAKQTDLAGNGPSAASGTLTVTIDTTAPGAPSAPDLATSSDSGASSADNITNVAAPTFTGTGAAAGATVTLFDGATAVGTAVADGSGNWSITSSTLAAGPHTMTARQADAAGNLSAASAPLLVTIDTSTGPPSTPDMTAGTDSGTSSTDNVTNVTTPTFTGTAEAGATVTLFDGGTQIGTGTADGGGAWSITSSALTAGGHSITAKQTDLAGNGPSAASGTLTVTIDVAAAAPSAPDLDAASDTGASNIDNATSDTTPTFNGTGAEAGATVTLFAGAAAVGTAVADGGGAWSITSSVLTDGAYTFTTKQTDLAGNTSAASTGLAVTIDTAPPAAPSAPDMTAATDSGTQNDDNITNDPTPTFTGTGAAAGATVTLFDTDGTTVLGTDVANGTGAWTITSSALAAGPHTLTAKQSDAAGNLSAASAALVVTIDTSTGPPSTPDMTAGTDSGASNTDNITNVTTPTFTGTAEAGATVTLFDGGTSVGSATADGGGAWSITSSALTAGGHSITAKQTDLAGNGPSAASGTLTVTIDIAAPAAPSAPDLDAASDTGASNTDNATSDTTPTFNGTGAEAGATVTLFAGAAAVGTAVADGGGAWSITSSVLTDGAYTFTTKQTDLAGNTSAASTGLAVTIDTVAPLPKARPDDTLGGLIDPGSSGDSLVTLVDDGSGNLLLSMTADPSSSDSPDAGGGSLVPDLGMLSPINLELLARDPATFI